VFSKWQAQTTSPKKIESNRRNSRRSTGPKTQRGKATSRYNALRLGVFASSRLLPTESSADYNRAAKDLLEDCRPTGAVEKILADQLIGAFWRLQRIERAEQTYFHEIKFGQAVQLIHALSDDELLRLKLAISRAGRSRGTAGETGTFGISESDGQNNRSNIDARAEFRKFDMLRRLANWDCTVLDGHVPHGETRPKACLDHQRRAVIRELMQALTSLRELQRSNGCR